MNKIAQKLQKCWAYKTPFKITLKMLKLPNFFHSYPFTLPNDVPVKFYLSLTFGLSSMMHSAVSTQSSTLLRITRIGNRNLECLLNDKDPYGFFPKT